MRVSTAFMYEQGLSAMNTRQLEIARAQRQLSSGLRVERAADDPNAFATGAVIDRAKSEYEAFDVTSRTLRHRLNIEDTVLGTFNDRLARVRELLVQSNSAILNPEARDAIANDLKQRLEEMLALANKEDGTGRYIFGGTQDASPPFALVAGSVVYSGDQSQRRHDVAPALSIGDTDPGSQAFMNIRSGNGTYAVRANPANTGTGVINTAAVANSAAWDGGTYRIEFVGSNWQAVDAVSNAVVATGPYVSGDAIQFRGLSIAISGAPVAGDVFNVNPSGPQDIFTTLQAAIAAVQVSTTTTTQRADQQNRIFAALEDINQVENHTANLRGKVGGRLASLDNADGERESGKVEFSSTLSKLRDLDYAEAISRLQLNMTALEAAQQTYMRISSLSLFSRM